MQHVARYTMHIAHNAKCEPKVYGKGVVQLHKKKIKGGLEWYSSTIAVLKMPAVFPDR